MADLGDEILGTSLKFPISVDSSGRPETVSGRDNIEQAIKDILLERVGQRFFLGQYGSNLRKLLYQPRNISANLLPAFIIEALRGERRIRVIRVNTDLPDDPRRVDAEIRYKIIRSNETKSFIFPFYTEELT